MSETEANDEASLDFSAAEAENGVACNSDVVALEEVRVVDENRVPYLAWNGRVIPTLHASSYPESVIPRNSNCIDVCGHCLGYAPDPNSILAHAEHCHHSTPPGVCIWKHGKLSMYEVGGKGYQAWCQNLALLMKLFIGCKAQVTMTERMRFYVLVEHVLHDEDGVSFEVVGAFSKFKDEFNKSGREHENVSCILVFPEFQGCGYGKFLVQFSYELTRREGRTCGSPERPLSNGGAALYTAFWAAVLKDEYGLAPRNRASEEQLRRIVKETRFSTGDLDFLRSNGVVRRKVARAELGEVERKQGLLPLFASHAELCTFVHTNFCFDWRGPEPDNTEDIRLSIVAHRVSMAMKDESAVSKSFSKRVYLAHGVKRFIPTAANCGGDPVEYVRTNGYQLPFGHAAEDAALYVFHPVDNSDVCSIVHPVEAMEQSDVTPSGHLAFRSAGGGTGKHMQNGAVVPRVVKNARGTLASKATLFAAAPVIASKAQGGKACRDPRTASKIAHSRLAQGKLGEYRSMLEKVATQTEQLQEAEAEVQRELAMRAQKSTAPSAMAHPLGIVNEGNYCYVASALQCLMSVPDVAIHLLGFNSDEAKHSPVTSTLSCVAGRMFGGRALGFKSVKIKDFTDLLSIVSPEFGNAARQCDMNEFLVKLIQRLIEEEFLEASDDDDTDLVGDFAAMTSTEIAGTLFGEIFAFSYVLHKQCEKCSFRGVDRDPSLSAYFASPTMGVSAPLTLNDMLRKLFEGENSKIQCESCRAEDSMTLKMAARSYPRCFLTTVHRMDENGRRLSRQFGFELDNFDLGSVFELDAPQASAQQSVYTLTAASYHTAVNTRNNTGHFCAFAKHGNTFYLYNDSTATTTSTRLVQGARAYTIVYVRNDCIGNATKRELVRCVRAVCADYRDGSDDDSDMSDILCANEGGDYECDGSFEDFDFEAEDTEDGAEAEILDKVETKRQALRKSHIEAIDRGLRFVRAKMNLNASQTSRGKVVLATMTLPELPKSDWSVAEREFLARAVKDTQLLRPSVLEVRNVSMDSETCELLARAVSQQKFAVLEAGEFALQTFDLVAAISSQATELNRGVNKNIPLARGRRELDFLPSATHCDAARKLRSMVDEVGCKVMSFFGKEWGMTHVKQSVQSTVHTPHGSGASLKRRPQARVLREGEALEWIEMRVLFNLNKRPLRLKTIGASGSIERMQLDSGDMLWYDSRTPLRIESMPYTSSSSGADPLTYVVWSFYATKNNHSTPGYDSIESLQEMIKSQDVPVLYDVRRGGFFRPPMYTKAVLESKDMQIASKRIARDVFAARGLVATPKTKRRQLTLQFHQLMFKPVYGFHCSAADRCSLWHIQGRVNKLYAAAPSLLIQSHVVTNAIEEINSISSASYRKFKRRTLLSQVEQLQEEDLMHREYTAEEKAVLLDWKRI